jgi:hypothetical protein
VQNIEISQQDQKRDENQFESVISQLKFPLGLLLQVEIQLRNKYAKYTLNLLVIGTHGWDNK